MRRLGVVLYFVCVFLFSHVVVLQSQLGYGDQAVLYTAGKGSIPLAGSINDQNVWSLKEQCAEPFDTDRYMNEMAKEYGLNKNLLLAISAVESGGRHGVRSSKGAIGIFQLMPSTAKALDVEPTSVRGNIRGGAKYLRQLLDRYKGDTTLALAAWNAGSDSVRIWKGVPPFEETRNFIAKVRASQAVLESFD